MSGLLSARGDINRLPCVFAPALRARCAVCGLSAMPDTPKGSSIQCTQPLARASCAALNGELRAKSRFALGLRPAVVGRPGPSVTLRVQGGGLLGLHQALNSGAHAIDVQRLLEYLNALPGGVDALPWPEILRAIARWQLK